jgi:hypothetical protein
MVLLYLGIEKKKKYWFVHFINPDAHNAQQHAANKST